MSEEKLLHLSLTHKMLSVSVNVLNIFFFFWLCALDCNAKKIKQILLSSASVVSVMPTATSFQNFICLFKILISLPRNVFLCH